MYMTKELMQWILAQTPPHPGFGFRVRENEWGVWLVCSLEEFAKYSQPQMEDLAAWMGWLCNSIRFMKIPCYIDRVDSFNDTSSNLGEPTR